jgi:rod shape determining protein RodA
MYIYEQKKILNLDYTFITTLLITCFLGTISFGMLYSAAGGYITPWALKQGLTFMILVSLMSILRFIKIKLIYKLSYHIYFFCVAALLIAEIVGYTTMGAQRWLKIGVINVQPSELAKLGLILALSKYFHHHFCIEESKIHIIIPIIIVLIPTILVLKQPNLGTALILIMIAASIYFVAGIDKWFFIIPLCTTLLSLPIAWNFLHGYQKKRVLIFLNPGLYLS